jgi:anti-sigma regulatory factor (Ser/Thr protein kinase)
VTACGEACANVVQHAYTVAAGVMDVRVRLIDESVVVSVRDRGAWRPEGQHDGGWGTSLMRELMDSVEVARGVDGTEVVLRRRVRLGDTT